MIETASSESEPAEKASPAELGPILESIFHNFSEPVRVLRPDLEIILENGAARLMSSGQPGSPGHNCDGGVPGRTEKCADCLVQETFRTGEPGSREVAGIDSNGDRWVTEVTTRPIFSPDGTVRHVAEQFRDISDEKRLERQYLQSAKLISVGEVATSIAHEIRNPLAGIRLGLDALDPEAMRDPAAKEILEDIIRDISRLDRVVSDLLNFARARESQPEWFPLGALFRQVIRYIRGQAEQQQIVVEIEVEPADLKIWGDRNQLHQVLLNLLLNSIQAMESGGTVRLTGKWGEKLNWSAEKKNPAGYRIVVKDTGPGIPEEYNPRLFDPFFTTKPNGTGLGLATSLSLIRRNNGELRINSKANEGTTALILLPEGEFPE